MRSLEYMEDGSCGWEWVGIIFFFIFGFSVIFYLVIVVGERTVEFIFELL